MAQGSGRNFAARVGVIGLVSAMGFAASVAHAEPVNLRHEGTASGSLRLADDSGRVIRFFDAAFVISAIADTDDRNELFSNPLEPSYGYDMTHQSVSIEIEGVGTFAMITETRTYAIRDADGAGRVGFGRTMGAGGLDLFNGPVMSEFADWDMTTDIELADPTGGKLTQWDAMPVVTDGGVLFFSFDDEAPWRFTATTVPAPASGVLLGLALVGARRRR